MKAGSLCRVLVFQKHFPREKKEAQRHGPQARLRLGEVCGWARGVRGPHAGVAGAPLRVRSLQSRTTQAESRDSDAGLCTQAQGLPPARVAGQVP